MSAPTVDVADDVLEGLDFEPVCRSVEGCARPAAGAVVHVCAGCHIREGRVLCGPCGRALMALLRSGRFTGECRACGRDVDLHREVEWVPL